MNRQQAHFDKANPIPSILEQLGETTMSTKAAIGPCLLVQIF
jgi:hypothetical protein